MSLEIYLTTEPKPDHEGPYRCEIWMEEPRQAYTVWVGKCGGTDTPSRRIAAQDLAALGFPPPGKMRVVTIGEYEEDS